MANKPKQNKRAGQAFRHISDFDIVEKDNVKMVSITQYDLDSNAEIVKEEEYYSGVLARHGKDDVYAQMIYDQLGNRILVEDKGTSANVAEFYTRLNYCKQNGVKKYSNLKKIREVLKYYKEEKAEGTKEVAVAAKKKRKMSAKVTDSYVLLFQAHEGAEKETYAGTKQVELEDGYKVDVHLTSASNKYKPIYFKTKEEAEAVAKQYRLIQPSIVARKEEDDFAGIEDIAKMCKALEGLDFELEHVKYTDSFSGNSNPHKTYSLKFKSGKIFKLLYFSNAANNKIFKIADNEMKNCTEDIRSKDTIRLWIYDMLFGQSGLKLTKKVKKSTLDSYM